MFISSLAYLKRRKQEPRRMTTTSVLGQVLLFWRQKKSNKTYFSRGATFCHSNLYSASPSCLDDRKRQGWGHRFVKWIMWEMIHYCKNHRFIFYIQVLILINDHFSFIGTCRHKAHNLSQVINKHKVLWHKWEKRQADDIVKVPVRPQLRNVKL